MRRTEMEKLRFLVPDIGYVMADRKVSLFENVEELGIAYACISKTIKKVSKDSKKRSNS
jgi:hypothetical protein